MFSLIKDRTVKCSCKYVKEQTRARAVVLKRCAAVQ